MLKPLRRASPDRVNKCMRKRASAKPVCAAAISASSLGWRSSVSVMRSDYRRYWNRATAGYRDAGRRPPLAYKAIRANAARVLEGVVSVLEEDAAIAGII